PSSPSRRSTSSTCKSRPSWHAPGDDTAEGRAAGRTDASRRPERTGVGLLPSCLAVLQSRAMRRLTRLSLASALFVFAPGHPSAQPAATRTSIVGATLIDGNGGAPIPDAVIVVDGARITAAGPRSAVTIPTGAQQVDARGRWIIPGLIDTNVHL